MRVAFAYRFLVALRLVSVLACLPGYIHPDEFFQSAEVVAGDVFHTEVHRPWEFNRTNPIRTVTFSYLTCGVPFFLLRHAALLFSSVPSHVLLIAPRLAVTLLSLLLDYFLYRTCLLFGKSPWKPLLILSTSYVTFTYHSRPFSNTVESILFAAVLFYVLKSLHRINKVSSKISHRKPKEDTAARYGPLYNYEIAFLVSAGFFNRPTFLLFVFAPMLFWVQYGLRPVRANVGRIAKRILSLLAGLLLTTVLLVVGDSLYYGYIGIEDVLDVRFPLRYNKLVWTPLNFVRYNADASNLSNHGLHPLWLHGLFHLPLLFVNLAVAGVLGYWKMVYSVVTKGSVDHVNPIEALMRCSFISPLILLSVFPHQEPRFLTPLLFPLVYLHGETLWRSFRPASLTIWVNVNFALFIFYGFFHQGGLIPMLGRTAELVAEVGPHPQVHLVFFRTYMPPRHLVTVPVPHAHLAFHDLEGADVEALERELTRIDFAEGLVFLFSPNTVAERFGPLHDRFRLYLVHQQWPHFSAEDLPPVSLVDSSAGLERYVKSFSLDLYNVTLQKPLDSHGVG